VKKPRSLRAALFRLVAIQAMVIMVVLFSVIALGLVLIQNQIVQRQQLLIDALARQGDQYLDETDRFMHTLANSIVNLPPGNRQDFLSQTRVNYPRFTNLYLVDGTGRVLIEDTDSTTLLGLDLSSTQFFNQARYSEQTFFSQPFISLATGKIAVTGATPIYTNNEFNGMLVGELNLARLQETIERVDIGEDGISFIVDQRGTLVAHPDSQWVQEQRNLNNLSLVQKGLAGGHRFELFYDGDQEEWLIGSVTPMGQNWAVIATQPAALVSRPLQILLVAAILALAISFGLYALTQRYTAKQITSPMSVLAQKVDALSSGQYEPLPVDQMGEFTEIMTLGQSFNRMVEAVAERTEKLMVANESLRQSEANLARAQQIAHLGSYSWNIQTNEIFWSEELKSILGITIEKTSFGLTNSLVHPDDFKQFSEAERLALEKGQPFDIEYRIIRPDGKVRYIHDQSEVIRDRNGQAIEVVGISLDITERRQAEEALRKSEAQLRLIAANIPGIVYQFLSKADGTQEMPYVSEKCYDILGLRPEEIQNDLSKLLILIPPEDSAAIQEAIVSSAVDKTDYRMDHRVQMPAGGDLWLRLMATPQELDNGDILWNGVAIDISDRKRAEEALNKRVVALTQPLDDTRDISFTDLFDLNEIQAIQDTFAQATGVASIITTLDGKPITKPSNFCRLCRDIIRKSDQGLTNCMHSDAIIGHHNPEGPVIQPCLSGGLWDGGTSISIGDKHIANWLIGQVKNEDLDEDEIVKYAREINVDEDEFRSALQEVTVMSKEQFTEIGMALFRLANQMSQIAYQNVQQARFITDRKQAEEQLQISLQEKEALLREIHHRVKNNLQVICALLDLQAETIADPQPREAFQESRNRVRSMAQIHEQLTHNENLAQVNMVSYIEELVSSLRVAYGTEAVAIQIDVSDITLPFDSVSPCGLLINELVSNAMKHAFPANASPGQNKIQIALQQLPTNNQMLELTVADNGVGLPNDTDPTNPDTLGLTLVNLLVRQLNASLNIEQDSGTTFRIVFTP